MLSTDARLQISETLSRQLFVVDENRVDRLGEVFAPEVRYDMTSSGMGTFQGLDALSAALRQILASGHAPLSHYVTNTVITHAAETTASVRSKALMIMHDGGVHGVVYDDTLTLHEGRWLIASRVIRPLREAASDER